MLGDIGDFVKATFGEVGHHPLQAAGAALGVPGYDPFFGGLFNNRPGGALLSPTGNFTSSAWNDMYKDNPNATGALDQFHRLNSVADVVAPAMAGGFASGALGSGGSGFSSTFAGSGADALGPSTVQGSGPLFGLGSGMGGSTLPGTTAPEVASASPFAGQFGGSSMAYPFTMPSGGTDMSPWLRLLSQEFQQQGQQADQRAQQASNRPSGMQGYANPQAVLLPSVPTPTVNPLLLGRQMLANGAGAMGGY
jgi:hypothetical protein